MNLSKTLHTKWGTAKITGAGYYQITNNHAINTKKLHRLIYEDFWGVRLPPEIVIHHKDGNRDNNCILNLEAMTKSEHSSLHNSKRDVVLETKVNLSKSKNTSGYFRVSWIKDNRLNRKGYWRYRCYLGDNKSKSLYADSIDELKQKVLEKGLEWRELNG